MVGDIIYKRSSRMNIAAFGAFMNVKYDLIAKRVFQENKAHQIFRKTNISYPLIRTQRVRIRGVSMFGFRKIWRALLP